MQVTVCHDEQGKEGQEETEEGEMHCLLHWSIQTGLLEGIQD